MPPIDRILIEKYIQGQCSPEEEEQVHRWIDTDDGDAYPALLAEYKYRRKEQKNWKRLASSLEGLKPLPVRRQLTFNFLFRYAAAFALLVLGAWVVNQYTHGLLWWRGEKYTTGYGETKQINLADGSVVMLNAMSELKISPDYGKDKRELYLRGEGYFKVWKDKKHPFIVYSNGVSTKALGTQFNVSAYPEDKRVIVSLEEGMVEVKAVKHTAGMEKVILLKPGEEAAYQPDRKAAKKPFVPKERLSWKEHVLYFKDAGIEQVMNELERYYGVSFDYSGLKDKDWKLNGEYKNQSLKDVLESLSFNYRISYKIKGNKVTLSQ